MERVIKVEVKYKKDTFKDVEIDFDQPTDLFRAKLFTLTHVPPDNQKIMFRGGATLKDDWAPFVGKIKSGQQVMLMGTAAENIAQAPPPEQVDTMEVSNVEPEPVSEGPAGLENLGNTCYMNASLQCLNSIPEIRESFLKFAVGGPTDEVELNIARSAKLLFTQMQKSSKTIQPLEFLLLFRTAFPQFAEMKNGKYVQQDAEEFWNQLLNCFRRLPKLGDPHTHQEAANLVEQLFEISMTDQLSCIDNPSEEKTLNHSTTTKLQCHISGGKTPTTQILEGIDLSMHEQIEKFSPSLQKTCLYNKQSSISKLPFYLTVQFVRFFWKKASEKKNKIVRVVDFPMTLDLYKYCTPDLQNKLSAYRNPTGSPPPIVPYTNCTGRYDLYAVITHKGVYADGGHYVAWIRQSENPNDWLLYDDKDVEKKQEEDIKKLNGSGGAQWHIAYLCIYKAKNE